MIQQISIFAENKPGKVERITRVLAEAGISMRAITISDLGDFGVIKILVSDTQKAYDRLRGAGLAARLIEVVAVPIPDEVGGLDRAATVLSEKGVNLKNAYGFVVDKGKEAVLLFEVDQPAVAAKVLETAGYKVLSEADMAKL
jgi:hypothetical protein